MKHLFRIDQFHKESNFFACPGKVQEDKNNEKFVQIIKETDSLLNSVHCILYGPGRKVTLSSGLSFIVFSYIRTTDLVAPGLVCQRDRKHDLLPFNVGQSDQQKHTMSCSKLQQYFLIV